ncbi:hypothetical protein RRG08_037746 [Elysia crispata]|uniref:Uncharacterized protein n=1 Tax=Elysia crispata TaxID=231223 RepID=A0AAE1DU47_9GAST|nr:hypothetical protein RRG08_037746 [Elysia crispata]
MSARYNDNVDYPVLVSQNDPRMAGNIDPEMQMEMAHIQDPRLVAVVKGHPGQARNEKNGSRVDGFQQINMEELKKEKNSHAKDEDEDEESDFDQELNDHDNREEAWMEANFLEKGILALQFGAITCYKFLKKITKGYFLKIVFLVAFTAYFIAAMIHEFGDEGSHRLLGCTLLGIFICVFPWLKKFIFWMARKCYGSNRLAVNHSEMWKKAKTVIRWTMYVVMIGVMIYTIVDEGREKPKNMRSLPGIAIFILIALLCSSRPSKVPWHTIFWSVALQFVCAVFVLKWSFGKKAFIWIQDRFADFFTNSKAGSILLFGQQYEQHLMAFGALPLLLFINAAFTVLYYLGVMQYIINIIGKALRFFLGVTNIEATCVSATIFMEGVATVMLMRPFVPKMSKSQLFLLITACMSSLGGGFVAIMSTFGVSLEYLIPAMLISAPATFAISKVMVPDSKEEEEEEDSSATDDLLADERKKYMNIFDAAQTGALNMLPTVVTVAVISYTFFSWVSWINKTLGWFGDRVGVDGLSIELTSSYLLYPVALAMGVDPEDCRRVAMLMGYRLGVYNVIAFLKMIEMKINRFKYMKYMMATNFTGPITKHRDDITLDLWNMTLTNGFISERSEAIVTYCLCGFSSFLSAALLTGILFALAPKRKKWINGVALPAVLAGHLANCMTGCFASLFY